MHKPHFTVGSARAGLYAALGFALFLAAGAFAAKAETKTPALDTSVRFDQPVIRKGEPSTIHMMIRVHSPREAWPGIKERPPINLALVLDRSGSMEDKGKLDYAKRAAKLMVEQLDPRDRVAIIEYDDRINVLWPSAPAENVREIHRRIDGLTSRGSTNLTGGMMRGVDEVLENYDSRDLNRVLLLSDGLANQGITDPYDIARMVRGARRDGVRISTVGLGLDYDENLMQAIAENGAGNYHYVEHPSQIARIFEEELSTLVRTTARDIKLRLRQSDGVKDLEVISVENATADDLAMGDMFAGETQTLMLRIEVDPGTRDDLDLGTLDIAYVDARDGSEQTRSVPLSVATTTDTARIETERDQEVEVEAALFKAERTHLEAIAAYEAGNTAKADDLLAELSDWVGEEAATTSDARLGAKLEAITVERAQMSAAAEPAAAPSARSSYLKSTKQRLYQAQSGKRGGYLLGVGDEGLEVERLQTALADAGYWSGPVDGKYTDGLEEAVNEYQAAQGIKSDGIAGPSTLQNLGLY